MNCISNIAHLNMKYSILPHWSEEILLSTAELLDGMKNVVRSKIQFKRSYLGFVRECSF